MSDFFNGVGAGLVGGNSLGGLAKTLTLAPYLAAFRAEQARTHAAQTALHSAQAADLQYGLDRRGEQLEAWRKDPTNINAKILSHSKFSDANAVASALLTGLKADAFGKIVNPGTGEDGRPVDTSGLVNRFNTASLALKGTEFANGRDPGMVLDPLHGNLIVGNKELHNADIGQRRADIGQKNASAYNSMQQGRNAGSGWSQVVETNDGGTPGYAVVNKGSGTARSVTLNGANVVAPQKGRANSRRTISGEHSGNAKLRAQAEAAIKSGKNEHYVKQMYKQMTGEDY